MGNLASMIDELAAEDLSTVPATRIADDALEQFRESERLHAQALRRLAVVDASGIWADDGSLSSKAWLRRHGRMTPGAAAERMRIARRLDEQPRTREAFEAGDIGYEHVRQVSRVLADTRDRLEPEKQDEAEAMLVDVAREHDPGSLRQVCEHLRHVVDAEGFRRSEADRFDRRRFHMSPLMDGMEVVDGLLDAEGSATLRSALDPLAKPVPNDTRTPSQRRADALVELARRALDRGDLPTNGGERPHVNVTVDLATLERKAGAPAAEMAWSDQPISGEAARRLACDAAVSRIITVGRSEPLDVGRRTRTIPPALRRAVIVRDGQCVEAGCDRPPEWCDVHHRVHWIDGGETTLSNLELRCHPHHDRVHLELPDKWARGP
jgi:hypothetical protein